MTYGPSRAAASVRGLQARLQARGQLGPARQDGCQPEPVRALHAARLRNIPAPRMRREMWPYWVTYENAHGLLGASSRKTRKFADFKRATTSAGGAATSDRAMRPPTCSTSAVVHGKLDGALSLTHMPASTRRPGGPALTSTSPKPKQLARRKRCPVLQVRAIQLVGSMAAKNTSCAVRAEPEKRGAT